MARAGPPVALAYVTAADLLDVVGIGADGWRGLGDEARTAVRGADVVMGSRRQLALLPPDVAGQRIAWPSPLLPALPSLLAEHSGRKVCVLASGDPMLHGIGATLARMVGADRLRVLPSPSSVSLACARLGWALQDVVVLSVLSQPVDVLAAQLAPGRRLLVLVPSGATLPLLCGLLSDNGFESSMVAVLSDLGAETERTAVGTATAPPAVASDLCVVAIECRATAGIRALSTLPGLPDDAFASDGQLTKRDLRAAALARLAPQPGELLWDVGAGAGSVGIEWSRHHPACRAVAVEKDPERADRIEANARRLGVPALRVVRGSAPEALADLPRPDAVFVGGGVSGHGVLAACWTALRPGGRLVVHAVTLESEAVVARWYAKAGGELTRLQVEHAAPLGSFTVWRPALAVVQLSVGKPEEDA
jgi:precorrin-6B C5,15-methyltransferase / cobalt-precorrin-6B C5,C15-methyltransferase